MIFTLALFILAPMPHASNSSYRNIGTAQRRLPAICTSSLTCCWIWIGSDGGGDKASFEALHDGQLSTSFLTLAMYS
jgi:hypothetical protein